MRWHSTGGLVLVSMFEAEPRNALVRQADRARQAGCFPMGVFELEFYLVDRERDQVGRYRPAQYALTKRRPSARNPMTDAAGKNVFLTTRAED